jgi:hypothetical protein
MTTALSGCGTRTDPLRARRPVYAIAFARRLAEEAA